MDEHKIPKVNNKSYTIYKVQLFDTNPFLLFTTTRERRRKKWSYGLIWIHLAFIGNFKRKWKHCIILRCALCALTRVYTIWGRKTTKRMEYHLWIYIWIGYLTMAYEKSLVLLLSVRICSTAFKGALSEYLEKHTWNVVRPCTKKHSTTRAKHSNKCNLWKHLLMKIRPSDEQSFHVVFLSLRLCYCKGLIVLIVFFPLLKSFPPIFQTRSLPFNHRHKFFLKKTLLSHSRVYNNQQHPCPKKREECTVHTDFIFPLLQFILSWRWRWRQRCT